MDFDDKPKLQHAATIENYSRQDKTNKEQRILNESQIVWFHALVQTVAGIPSRLMCCGTQE